MDTLTAAAHAVLTHADPAEKCRLTRAVAARWTEGGFPALGNTPAPDRPARPDRPVLLAPREMPKRAYGGERGRIGLVHALAHIELNAIDLAWDIVARFVDHDLPAAFFTDWIGVAVDEARHFELLCDLLAGLGAAYGDLPAHDGLWQAAEKTADDLTARLVVVPLTLEARGLDTTPATIDKLRANGDTLTPPVLQVIFEDEITHVAAGLRWFRFLSERAGLDARAHYHTLLTQRFPGGLKAPFNHDARAQAGFPRDWYETMARG